MGSTTWRLGGVKVLMERRGGEGGQREGLEPERSEGGGGAWEKRCWSAEDIQKLRGLHYRDL